MSDDSNKVREKQRSSTVVCSKQESACELPGWKERDRHVGLSNCWRNHPSSYGLGTPWRFVPRGYGSKRPIATPAVKNVCAAPRAIEGHRRFARLWQGAKLTFATRHLIVSFWLLGALSPYAAVRAQIPPADSSVSSLDLTLHVHPALAQPGTSFDTNSSGDRSDCDRRKESATATKSDSGTIGPGMATNTSRSAFSDCRCKSVPGYFTWRSASIHRGVQRKNSLGPDP